jgi:hypothetical protein
MTLAFWTAGDLDRMDRLFRQSGLMRDKWDEKHGKETYGQTTLGKAVARCTNHYEPTPKTPYKEELEKILIGERDEEPEEDETEPQILTAVKDSNLKNGTFYTKNGEEERLDRATWTKRGRQIWKVKRDFDKTWAWTVGEWYLQRVSGLEYGEKEKIAKGIFGDGIDTVRVYASMVKSWKLDDLTPPEGMGKNIITALAKAPKETKEKYCQEWKDGNRWDEHTLKERLTKEDNITFKKQKKSDPAHLVMEMLQEALGEEDIKEIGQEILKNGKTKEALALAINMLASHLPAYGTTTIYNPPSSVIIYESSSDASEITEEHSSSMESEPESQTGLLLSPQNESLSNDLTQCEEYHYLKNLPPLPTEADEVKAEVVWIQRVTPESQTKEEAFENALKVQNEEAECDLLTCDEFQYLNQELTIPEDLKAENSRLLNRIQVQHPNPSEKPMLYAKQKQELLIHYNVTRDVMAGAPFVLNCLYPSVSSSPPSPVSMRHPKALMPVFQTRPVLTGGAPRTLWCKAEGTQEPLVEEYEEGTI